MKSKHPVNIKDLRVVTSDGDVIPPSVFPHMDLCSNGGLHKVPGGGSAGSGSRS